MINLVICEDNKDMNRIINSIVDQVMMNNDLDYKKHNFFDYDNNFLNILESQIPNKIYIMDIMTKSASGIDIARNIRKKDMDSVIIFLSSREEYIYTISKLDLMFLTFINKFDTCSDKLCKSLNKALEIVGNKHMLVIQDNATIYNIPLNDILYITRDSVSRNCFIKTNYSEFCLSKSLTDIMSLLNKDFIYSYRSCIVNTKNIVKVDKKNKLIYFNDGEKIDVMNDSFKKEIDKYLTMESSSC